MKVTNENRDLFNEIKQKYGLKKEGLLSFFLKKNLEKKLKNDTELQSALKSADADLLKLQNLIKDMEKQGKDVPSWAKRFKKAK